MTSSSKGDSPAFAAAKRQEALTLTYHALRAKVGFWQAVAALVNLGVPMEDIEPVATAAGDLVPTRKGDPRG